MLLSHPTGRFASLVTGTDPKQPLPLPRPAAQRLKEQSLLAIRGWNEKFGEGYPRLRLGFNYLKHNKKVQYLISVHCKVQPL